MTRIKIALGNLQLEYEGEPGFLEEDFFVFLERLLDATNKVSGSENAQNFQQLNSGAYDPEISTNTIAQTMGTKTGSELALAAIAKINLVRQRPTASRQEILEEMKGATTYFKESYASNLSSYLDTLVRSKRVNLVARHQFALAANERNRIREVLGVPA